MSLSLALSHSIREMRAGLTGFFVFLGCLIIGTATITVSESLNRSVRAGLDANAQTLLGGDLSLRVSNKPATSEQLAFLDSLPGRLSNVMTMPSMARKSLNSDTDEWTHTLVSIKAVDGLYPLYGTPELSVSSGLQQLLTKQNGRYGAVVEPALLHKLGAAQGDIIHIGEMEFDIRAVVTYEPDRINSFVNFGPRVFLSLEAMTKTGLLQNGSRTRYRYRLAFDGQAKADAVHKQIETRFPDAGWRIRGLDKASNRLTGFFDNIAMYLTLVGLTALLVGGIGIANAVNAMVDSKIRTIAMIKCVGATSRHVFTTYFLLVGQIGLLGVAVGLLVGLGLSFLLAPQLNQFLPVAAAAGFYPPALVLAAAYGLLIVVVFSLWPLAKASVVPPVALFRHNLVGTTEHQPGKGFDIAMILLIVLLSALVVFSAERKDIALAFVFGSFITIGLFMIASQLVMMGAFKLARHENFRHLLQLRPVLRLALANLCRPGATTMNVVLSMGLGLTVLVTITQVDASLRYEIEQSIPDRAPVVYMIDIQDHQEQDFRTAIKEAKGAKLIRLAKTIRGRITKLNGVPVEKATISPEVDWAVRGDRLLSFAHSKPSHVPLVKGKWWDSDHNGPENYVSVVRSTAEGLGLDIGSTVTFNVLGRPITATVKSLREVNWKTLQMNFAFLLTPHTLAGAPHTMIASLAVADGFDPLMVENEAESQVLKRLPNVTSLRIREALENAIKVISAASGAIRITAIVTLVSGLFVLAGAVAAGHRRRVYESVLLKVQGATRGQIFKSYLLEYGIMGLVTGVMSAALGSVAAWSLMEHVMNLSWLFLPVLTGVLLAGCLVVMLLAGFAGTYKALGEKPAPLLRNE